MGPRDSRIPNLIADFDVFGESKTDTALASTNPGERFANRSGREH